MTTIDIRIGNDKPEISLSDSDIFLDGYPFGCASLFRFSVVSVKSGGSSIKAGFKRRGRHD